MKKVSIFCLFALVLFMSQVCSAQVEYVFVEGVNSYAGSADTTYWPEDPENIVGANESFEYDTSSLAYALIRFDDIIGTGSNQIPPDSTVVSAFVYLTITGSGSSDQIATLHELTKLFSEEADFIDFTENYDMIPDDDYDSTVIQEIPGPSSGDIVELNVTSSLAKYLAGETNYGWIIVPGGSDGVDIMSSEGADRTIPVLEVSTPLGVFTFKYGLSGYDSTVDTFINTGNGADVVYGENNWFEWDGSDNGGINYGLLRFDDIIGTGANQIPHGTTIDSARLLISIQDAGDTATIYEILPGTEGESTDFDNTTTSLIDFGDGFEPIFGIHYSEDPVAEIVGEIGTQELDVTSSIQKYSAGETNTGWIFVPSGGGGVEAVSSEALSGESGPPRLTVTVEGEAPAVIDYMIY